MTDTSHPLHLSPKPPVTKLNKKALILIFGVLLGVILIAIYAMPSPSNTAGQPQARDASTAHVAANPEQGAWAQQQSNALPGHALASAQAVVTPTVANPTVAAVMTTMPPAELKKRRDEALFLAMNSPLSSSNSAPTFSNALSTTTPSHTPTPDNNRLPVKALNNGMPEAASEPVLLLSTQQVEKLQNLLGVSLGDQNQQSQKKAFLADMKKSSDKNYLHENVNATLSRYEIKAGTVITAMLIEGITSDLPGISYAQVTENVYDSVSGKYLLIPQGAKLQLVYDSQIAFGQNRVLIAAKRIIFPNGKSLDLAGMPGADVTGMAGFSDKVDNHYLKIFGSAALLGVISAGFQLSQPSQNSILQNPSAAQTASAAMGQQMGQVAANLMNKNINIQPTLEIRSGYLFHVKVTADMVFPGAYQDE